MYRYHRKFKPLLSLLLSKLSIARDIGYIGVRLSVPCNQYDTVAHHRHLLELRKV